MEDFKDETAFDWGLEPMTEIGGQINQKLAAILFSDAMVLGAITILGYLMAFGFETGEANALGIPAELISVSLEDVLTSLVGLLIIFMVGSLVIELVMTLIPPQAQTSILFRPIGSLFLMFTIPTIAGFYYSPLFYAFDVIAFLVLCNWLMMPFFGNKRVGTYLERLTATVEQKVRDTQHRPWIVARVGWIPLLLLGAFAASVSVGEELGNAAVRNELYHFVSVDKPTEVLVARYGELLVFRLKTSPAVIVRVIGKDAIPNLTKVRTGSMAIDQQH